MLMKHLKIILLALFCIFFTANVLATNVTKNDAAKVAKNYFSEVLFSNGNLPSNISESIEITKDGNTVVYVFNFEKGGYVMVSAEDRYTPIIGYSPTGYYEQYNVPDGLQFLLEEYSEMISLIRAQNISGEPQYAEKWERYLSDNLQLDKSAAAVVVAPMTALWNQDSPYNFYAPPASGGPGGKAYAGCVATAMSIIMYYWRWPWQGTGEKSYNPIFPASPCPGLNAPDFLQAKFGETTYDFNGMFGTPEVSADKVLYEPIALLQFHAGVSVSMMYCGDGSGAYSYTVPSAMRNYFKYASNIQQVQRTSYSTTAAWTTMLKGQLDLQQPVYVSGQGPSGGHAFVCDGYNTDDYVHYNFGWSGSANGYFVSDKPNEFTSSVAAVINFIPDRSQGYPINGNDTWTVSWMKGNISDCSGPVDFYNKGVTSKWLIDPGAEGNVVENITINYVKMNLAAGDYLRIYDGDNESATLLGEFTGNNPFDAVTSSGDKVLVKFTSAPDSPTAQGFMISYDVKAKQCCDPRNPITITNSQGSFTDGSPENMNYNNSTGPCKWFIYPKDAIAETEITLSFTRIDTEEGVDEIKIMDMDKNKLIATFSGKYLPTDELPVRTVNTKKIQVSFSSNPYINGKGFEVNYQVTHLGIKQLENVINLTIYPNPVKDRLYINFFAEVADNFDINIYTVTGQEIYKETLTNFTGDYNNMLNMSNFSQGIYLLQIKSSKGMITRKFVK